MTSTLRLTQFCIAAALLAPVFSSAEDLLLYTPKPAEAEQAPKSPDEGVLVRSITVKRGDTLKKLSRAYLGRASWFPQVLVFNEIKNPDLIHPGERLKVPVPAGKSAAAEPRTPVKKHARTRKARHHHRAAVHHAAAAPSPEERATPTGMPEAPKTTGHEAAKPAIHEAPIPATTRQTPASSAEQEAYRQAKLAYLQGDYRKSLSLFDSFLQKYPNSGAAADAALYRADCLLHLSGK